jgi:hypothetical protein
MASPKAAAFLFGLLFLAVPATAKSPFAGIWDGRINGLPGIIINIEDSGDKIVGTMTFYLQMLGDDGKWRVMGKVIEPLLKARMDGKSFIFEVSHRYAHPGEGYDRDRHVKYRIEFTSSDEALLRYINYYPNSGPLRILRRRLRYRK